MRQLLNGKYMDEVSIERLQAFEEAAVKMHPDGYDVAYSGGKDSEVILDLAKRAGVKFTAHHNLTTCDPPELVYHVKTHPEVQIVKPKMSIWELIRHKGMPPRRTARFCCEVLKEGGGHGRMLVTGVRWQESARRANRQMVEACYRDKTKRYIHPIIDWKQSDVWEYIRERKLTYCKLYDEGWYRVGCVLCPMVRDTARHIARWPKIAAAWERAIKATWKPDESKRTTFKTPEEYWQWWLDRDAPGLEDPDDPQCRMFFEDEGRESTHD